MQLRNANCFYHNEVIISDFKSKKAISFYILQYLETV